MSSRSFSIYVLDVLLGEKDAAIATLLDTPLADSNWYANYLKAAIVAASVSQESFQSTVGSLLN